MGKKRTQNEAKSPDVSAANLSSKLFDSSRAVDSELDAIFQSSAKSVQATETPTKETSKSSVNSSKRKRDDFEDPKPNSHEKNTASPASATTRNTKKIKKAAKSPKDHESLRTSDAALETEEPLPQDHSSDSPAHQAIDETDTSDEDSTVPLHESLTKPTKPSKKSTSKIKFAPEGETKEDINSRTVFVGNLPKEIVASKTTRKSLIRHLTSFVPPSALAKVESTRFRSVAFNTPSGSKEHPEAEEDDLETGGEPSARKIRQRDRTATWREAAEEAKSDAPKVYLKPHEKKKIAFITKDLNDKSQTVNCYVVFAHHPPSSKTAEAMHPAEVAKLVVEGANGTLFMERTIRVDFAERKGAKPSGTAKDDMKRTIFVGNLDFEATEETLRTFFETTVKAERGDPPDGDEGHESRVDLEEEEGDAARTSSNKSAPRWVTHVRVVRDKDTQLGKGFAYVQFRDKQSVDEILALTEDRLKFAKRKLRVQRCKTIPGGSLHPPKTKTNDKSSAASKNAAPGKTNSAKRVPTEKAPEIPKGDPSLGDRLASLPKSERKQVKSSDPDRVARRLAKKKARISLGKQTLKTSGKDGVLGKPISIRTNRKNTGSGKRARIRSDRAIGRKNTKK
ncbi:hypothetical protein FRC03_001977 [Tulasnella sp. 419]|nr:hypothetical protein FRC03_001977 [Tulasnella sp. 419]